MRITIGSSRRGQPVGVVGKIAQSIFFLLFAGIGLFVGGLFVQQAWPSLRSWTFAETPALVLTSQVTVHLPGGTAEAPAEGDTAAAVSSESGSNDRYRLTATYRYQAAGAEHTTTSTVGGNDIGGLERRAAALRPGSQATVWVDPQDPANAVLRRTTPWSLLILIVPAVFVAFGLGGIVAIWRGGRGHDGPSGSGQRASISRRKVGGRGLAAGFLGLFGAIGLLILIPFFALPAWKSLAARGWTETPCTILWSDVGDHGDTYSVDVLYGYEVGGVTHRGSRYHFFGGSSSGYDGKRQKVDAIPAGSTQTCRVDPADAYSSVLRPELGSEAWFALIPGIFVLIGFGGMSLVLAHGGAGGTTAAARVLPALRQTAAEEVAPGVYTAGSDVLVLEPTSSPLGKLIGVILAAIVVNGLVGAFAWFAVIAPWRKDDPIEGCVALFLIPFALVAIGLLISVPYQFLALFNPRPHLELTPAPLTLGRATRLSWRFRGRASRLTSLKMTLAAKEQATYRVGTRSSTATAEFYNATLLDTRDPMQIAQGEIALELPRTSMHSFDGGHNKVTWTLEVAGEIARWPDVGASFELAVAPPLPLGSRGTSRSPRTPLAHLEGGRGGPGGSGG